MNIGLTGLPLAAIAIGFIVIFSIPIWMAAKVVGVFYPTFLRASMSLVLGTAIAFGAMTVGGIMALVIIPIGYLLTFKFVLGATLGEAFLLSVLALIGCALMVKLVGGAVIGYMTGTGVT